MLHTNDIQYFDTFNTLMKLDGVTRLGIGSDRYLTTLEVPVASLWGL
jgi:hypothetical protein